MNCISLHNVAMKDLFCLFGRGYVAQNNLLHFLHLEFTLSLDLMTDKNENPCDSKLCTVILYVL